LSRLARLSVVALLTCVPGSAWAQPHDHSSEAAATPGAWTLHLDGALFGTLNRQGGPRGETEFVSQNWVMAMGTRRLGPGSFTIGAMLSAEPMTTGRSGYSEIFQVGEAFGGLQLTDRQHPHDFAMQLAAAWRVPIGQQTGLTVAGGPRGEAALGPVAFMHRPSSSANPSAPLSHHVFDSTHISNGVVLLGLDRGPWALEGSWFRGREPDEYRYGLETGGLDSWSVRLWFRRAGWSIQGSHGFLHEPEQLEPGDQRRTNASVSWLRERGNGFTALTAAAGRNQRQFSTVRAVLAEFTHQVGRTSLFSRFEDLTVETEILLFPEVVHRPHPGELVDPVRQLTVGGLRQVWDFYGFTVGLGGDVVVSGVPPLLQFTHGSHPVSYHLFVRLLPPARRGRMWNTTMGQPMDSHAAHGGAHR